MNVKLETPAFSHPCTARDVERVIRNGPERLVDVGHSRIAYWRFGSGPDLLFVHGWPLHAATFRSVVPALAQHFTCHLIDLPYVGQTQTDAAAKLNIDAYVDVLEAMVAELGLERYGLLAHDSGALMARKLAARDAKRVTALVLGNTEIPGHFPLLVAFYIALARIPGGQWLLQQSMRLGTVRRSSLGFRGCFSDMAFGEGDFARWFVDPITRGEDHGQLELLRHFDKSAVANLRQTHAAIQAPVRLIWGTDDPFFPLELAREMLPQFAGPAELRTIEGAKLFAHEDHPEQFVAEALPFLLEHLS
jgi:haloalkane dehalogenase